MLFPATNNSPNQHVTCQSLSHAPPFFFFPSSLPRFRPPARPPPVPAPAPRVACITARRPPSSCLSHVTAPRIPAAGRITATRRRRRACRHARWRMLPPCPTPPCPLLRLPLLRLPRHDRRASALPLLPAPQPPCHARPTPPSLLLGPTPLPPSWRACRVRNTDAAPATPSRARPTPELPYVAQPPSPSTSRRAPRRPKLRSCASRAPARASRHRHRHRLTGPQRQPRP